MHSQASPCEDNIVQRYCVQLETLEKLPTLTLGRLVDKVVKDLDVDKVGIYGLVRSGSDLLERLKSSTQDCAFDPNGECVNVFEDAEALLVEWKKWFSFRRESAVKDTELNSNLEHDVLMAFDSVLAAQGELLTILDTVKWYILEHDADLEPNGEVYDNVEDLIASLKD